MRKLQYILTLLIAMLLSKNIQAQLPVNDSAWVLQASLSDEFNGTHLDTDIYYKWYTPSNAFNAGGKELDYKRNVTLTTISGSNKAATIKVDTLIPNVVVPGAPHTPYQYQGGEIISQGSGNYKYGYIEINAKFPTGHTTYWPTFWFTRGKCDPLVYHPTSASAWYNEIDVVENANNVNYAGNMLSNNWHLYNPVTPDSCPYDPGGTGHGTNDYEEVQLCCTLSAAYHKYGLQWDTTGMYFYFDDNLIRTVLSSSNAINAPTPSHGLNLVLSFGIYPWGDTSHSSNLPAYLYVDYVHDYKLTADCGTPVTITSPSGYDRKVKQSITTSSSNTFNYSPSDWNHSYTLRASDYVLLDAPATGQSITINPSGSGSGAGYFAIEVKPCPN